MPLRPCPRCARTVSDLAPRCPSCGAEFAAAAPYPGAYPAAYPPARAAVGGMYQPPRPYGAGENPVGPLMRVGQVLAVLFCFFAAFAKADWGAMVPDGDGVMAAHASGQAMGYAIGTATAPLLMSALFLVWSRKTRRYIPFLAVAFVFISAAGNAGTRRQEVDAELSRTRGLVSAFADSAGEGVEDASTSAPPESERARMVWATNRALAEVPAHIREVAGRHDVDPDHLPAAWGTSRYMAAAASHPEVERYWVAYLEYLADFQAGFPDWLQSRVAVHARGAGVRSGVVRAFTEGMSQGSAGFAQSDPMVWADSTATAALAYHRFLVSVDARMSYDEEHDQAMFSREADLDRANALQDRVARAADRLTRAQQAAARRSMQQVDSLAVRLR